MGEWKKTLLGDLVELKRGYDLPKTERRAGTVPVISSSGPIGFHDAAKAKGPGVVTGRYGTLGQVFYVHDDFWPLNTTLYVRDFKGNDPQFMSYLLRCLDFLAYSDKAAVPGINRNHLHQAAIVAPLEVSEQRAIAHILGTLDDKIELNRRMSETLEDMARALFKSWFVDFDPVRAKAEGRDPGLPRPLADLFPDRLVDSELGESPEGWEVAPLGDLLELAYGRALKAEVRRDGTFPVYGSNGQIGWHDEKLVTGPGIVVGRKGNPGVATWVPTDFFPIDTAFYVAPKPTCQDLEFLFHALRHHDLASFGADSAVPGLNRNLAYMSMQLLPPVPVRQQFGRITRALHSRVNCGHSASRTLATLRDTLLPKLISGEMRVPDAAMILASADA